MQVIGVGLRLFADADYRIYGTMIICIAKEEDNGRCCLYRQ